MSTSSASEFQSEAAPVAASSAGDYFFSGVMVMLAINVVQRMVGLARSLGFCRLLSDEQLGAWALANSFFAFIIPVAVLGLTGSFGRFVEHYRCKNQLGDFLRSVLAVVAAGALIVVAALLLAPKSFAWLVFNREISSWTLVWCVATVVSLVFYTVIYEVVAGLREVRVMSIMQFVQSTFFALSGLVAISMTGEWSILLPCFATACILACAPGAVVLWSRYRGEFQPSGKLVESEMWRRVLPFAAGLWLLNMLGNLLETGDRYMLLHLSATAEAGQSAVGQYHCGMVLPNLMLSVAMMLGGVVLPFIAADWEAGKKERVAARLRQILNSVSIGFIGLGVATLVVAPWLFEIAFSGRYDAAREVVPLALAQAVWLSLFMIAETYFLCVEKTRTLIVLQAIGLVTNLLLNWILIRQFGLSGAITATAISALLTLLLLHRAMAAGGCELGKVSLILCLVPGVLVAGPVVSLLVIGMLVWLSGRTNIILSQQDRSDIDAALLPKLAKLGLRPASLWP